MRVITTFFTIAIAFATTKTYAATSNSTSSKTFIEFKSKNGDIYADDQLFYFKGVNWFGTETIEATLQGLWPYATTVPDALDLLAGYDINALRLPLALDSVLNDPEVNKDQTDGTPSLAGKSYLDILDYVINEARKRNMVIILDNHRIEAGEPDFPDTADPTVIIPALERLAARYCSNPSTWNVIGIDIKNEPKGKATWGDGNEVTDWSIQAATIGNAVLAKCPRWLIFVEGVQNNIKGVTLDWGQVGGSLQGAKKYPVKLKNMERLVYSPHVISPGIDFKSPWWSDSSFPKNMNKIWTSAFGSTPSDTKQAVVVGAWGSKMDGIDGQWATQLSSYLVDKSIGSFYWAFNPQSANTGGLVKDDWKTPIAERFELLSALPSTKLDKILSKYATCTTSCTGYGQCTDGKCVCYAGWSGPQCDICTPGDTEACNKGGTCQKDSTCLCDDHVGGKYCGGIECDGVVCGTTVNSMCLNGQCVCKFNCIGNQCTSCAANASMITNTIESCDTCAAAVKDESHANGLIVGGIEMMIVMMLSLMM